MAKEMILNVIPKKRNKTIKNSKKSSYILTVSNITKLFEESAKTDSLPSLTVTLPINDKERYVLTINIDKTTI